ncbi:metallophosphoesterase [Candidatus Saccharibacteria bacterium]|nr:metallophosphoesterase [Candidatus Saccharibacteria bacterium]
MKLFYQTRYRFYSPHQNLKFFLFSDLHFSRKVTNQTLDAILAKASSQAPDYILFTGDLVDQLADVDAAIDRARLLGWLEKLATVAPVLLILGNHDFYRRNPHRSAGQLGWIAERNEDFLHHLSEIKNLHLLDNAAYSDHHVHVLGFTQSFDYYHLRATDQTAQKPATEVDAIATPIPSSESFQKPRHERADLMYADLKNLSDTQPKLLHNLPQKKAKIALIHSPINLDEPSIAHLLKEFDFIISGHMHGGLVPPGLQDFWHSDRGFVAPGKSLFPKNARNYTITPDNTRIVLGAITTVQNCTGVLSFLNKAFPINIATLELSKSQIYARKPDISSKYLEF